jgi:hypothetical protein
VEWLVEYQQAVRMPALRVGITQENVSFLALAKHETYADILSTTRCFYLEKKFVWKV